MQSILREDFLESVLKSCMQPKATSKIEDALHSDKFACCWDLCVKMPLAKVAFWKVEIWQMSLIRSSLYWQVMIRLTRPSLKVLRCPRMAMAKYSQIEKWTSSNVFRFRSHQRAANMKVKDVQHSSKVLASSWSLCIKFPDAKGASSKKENLQSLATGRSLGGSCWEFWFRPTLWMSIRIYNWPWMAMANCSQSVFSPNTLKVESPQMSLAKCNQFWEKTSLKVFLNLVCSREQPARSKMPCIQTNLPVAETFVWKCHLQKLPFERWKFGNVPWLAGPSIGRSWFVWFARVWKSSDVLGWPWPSTVKLKSGPLRMFSDFDRTKEQPTWRSRMFNIPAKCSLLAEVFA